jgi:hypothetical protein
MKWTWGLIFLAMMSTAHAVHARDMEVKNPAPVSCPSTQPMVSFSSTHKGCVLYWLSTNGATIAGVRDLKTNSIVEQPALNLHYEGK